MKIIKILLFIATILMSLTVSYYSYLFITPIGATINAFYEGIIGGEYALNEVGKKSNEIVYKTKLGFMQTKAMITKNTTQIQNLQNERMQELQKKELEQLENIEHIKIVQKSILVLPYILSGLIGFITFFFLSSKLFQLKIYLASARIYFSDSQEV